MVQLLLLIPICKAHDYLQATSMLHQHSKHL